MTQVSEKKGAVNLHVKIPQWAQSVTWEQFGTCSFPILLGLQAPTGNIRETMKQRHTGSHWKSIGKQQTKSDKNHELM